MSLERPVETLEDARWSCSQCGFCCTFVTLGPVAPGIIAGLEARAVERDWAPAADGWYETRGGEHYLRRVDGGCVFLRPDRRCAVHDLYGAEAKPGFCRAFPLHAVETAGTVAVVVRADCSGVHETLQTGEPVAAQVEALLALDSPRARFDAWRVEALPGVSVETSEWLRWERALIDGLSQRPLPPRAAVAWIRGELAALAGQPPSAADPVRYRLAWRAAAEGLRLVTDRAAEGGGSPAEVAFARENLRRLEAALAAASADDAPSVEVQEYLGVLLRGYLLGKQYKGVGGPAAGLGLFLVTVEVAAASAGSLADLDALARDLSRLTRFLNNHAIQRVVLAARPALVDVFLNA